MKRSKILTSILFLVFSSGCESLVEDINTSPNLPTDASSDLILTGMEVATILAHGGDISRKAGMWSGYFQGVDRQYFGFHNYITSSGDYNDAWEDIYENVYRNSVVLQQKLQEENRPGVTMGIAKILGAHVIGTATALWGDVPFSEAGDFVRFPNPSYEDQLEVYNTILGELDAALLELENPLGRPVEGADIFFNGDLAAWTEVANTLKARYYLHQSRYADAYDAALNGISAPERSWLAPFEDENGAQNLYFQFYAGNRAEDMTSSDTYFVSILDPSSPGYRGNNKTNEGARLAYLLSGSSGIFNANVSEDGFFGADNPYPLVSYEENLLILAEAGARSQGFNTGLDHLNELRAYNASGGSISSVYLDQGLQYDPYTEADFDAGGIAHVNGFSRDESLLREILEERYITMFGQIETFNDLRRTLDEAVRVPVPPNTGAELPRRFLYPQTEIDRNSNFPSGAVIDIFQDTPVNQ